MRIEDITLDQLMKISKGIQPSKFTVKYWFDKAEKVEEELGLDTLDSRAIVQVAFMSRKEFKNIRYNIKFGIENAKSAKARKI